MSGVLVPSGKTCVIFMALLPPGLSACLFGLAGQRLCCAEAQQKAVEHQLVVAVHALYGCGESLRLCLGVLFFLLGFHAVHLAVLFVSLSFFKSTCLVACVNYYSFFNVPCQGIFSKIGCFSELVVV